MQRGAANRDEEKGGRFGFRYTTDESGPPRDAERAILTHSPSEEALMELLRIASAKALVLVLALICASATLAGAAVVLRTPPFPGFDLVNGNAFCVTRNGGTADGQVTVRMFDGAGNLLATDAHDLDANDADAGTTFFLSRDSPTWCECTVPSAATFTCSFVYNNGLTTAVVPAQ